MQATITSKGQITLPKALRDRLSLSSGDKIEFFLEDNDVVRIVPRLASVAHLKGMLPKPTNAVSLQQMDQAMVDSAAKK